MVATGGIVVTLALVVQHPMRLLRVGMVDALAADPMIEVQSSAVTGDELLELCSTLTPAVAVLDVGEHGWDLCRLAYRLQRQHPALRFVGHHSGEGGLALQRVRRCGIRHAASSGEGESQLRAAVQAAARSSIITIRPPAADLATRLELTSREVDVLQLIGAGYTAREVSNRLNITSKTVENHKQRIFTKLVVQSQAQAVSVALRRGYIAGDVILKLADQVS